MRKVIGIGETVFDILFREEQPTAGIPGGSVFNGIISLGRMGIPTSFITETGNDRIGRIIKNFMEENQVDTQYVNTFADGKSAVSLAFLDQSSNPEYMFYKDYAHQRLNFTLPPIQEDDILLFGSYYALNPALREKISELLEYARTQKAIIYYDPNFRSTHKQEAIKLMPAIMENLEYADIVRGSADDFENMYNNRDTDFIYKNKIQFYCPNFICTSAENPVRLRTSRLSKEYPVKPIQAVSTVGSGDNFNAGILFGLLKYRIRHSDLSDLSETDWDALIQCGQDFSADVCMNLGNSVSESFVQKYKEGNTR